MTSQQEEHNYCDKQPDLQLSTAHAFPPTQPQPHHPTHLQYMWVVIASTDPSWVICTTSSPSQPAPAPGFWATRY